ncbi:MAG: hypothetical protein MZV70_16610 [Desulfobacterales bacterium]|nr:hypothetical protein [Desulfobacterales bacterium]
MKLQRRMVRQAPHPRVSFAATRNGSTGYESVSAPAGMTAYSPRRTRTTRPAFWWYARSASCARPPTSPWDDRCLPTPLR